MTKFVDCFVQEEGCGPALSGGNTELDASIKQDLPEPVSIATFVRNEFLLIRQNW